MENPSSEWLYDRLPLSTLLQYHFLMSLLWSPFSNGSSLSDLVFILSLCAAKGVGPLCFAHLL